MIAPFLGLIVAVAVIGVVIWRVLVFFGPNDVNDRDRDGKTYEIGDDDL